MLRSLIMLVIPFPLFIMAVVIAGSSLVPALWVYQALAGLAGSDTLAWQALLFKGLGIAAGYYTFGFAQILVAPLINLVFFLKVKPYRGPAVSPRCLRWYFHNAIVLWVRYSFLEFVTPTEWVVLYFRLMGMKIGRNVTINSTAITDPSIITLEDNVTIGGSANVIAHYSQGGYLIVAPVVIRKGATLGLRCTVMAGVEVGEKAKVLANSFVLPNTKIPAGETWGGIPAVRVELRKAAAAPAAAAPALPEGAPV